MLKAWKYVVFFVLCLAVGLALTMPAQHLLPYLNLPKSVRVSAMQGTLVEGRAAQVEFDGTLLREVEYRFLPSCLVSFRVCYDIDYSQGKGQAGYGILDGNIEITDARVEYPAADFARRIPNLIVQLIGRLEVSIDSLAIVAGKPTAVNGNVVWRGLGVDDGVKQLVIGDYAVDIAGGPEGYDLKISDLAGNLEIDGEGRLEADGQYRLDVRVVGKENIEPQIRTLLDLAGNKVSQDHYRIEQSGRLPASLSARIFP